MKNICIIGCGSIGHLHGKNLSASANLFFYSNTKKSAEKFKNKFKGKKVFNTIEEVLNSEEIDAVVISSPPEFHREQIINSLKAGKSVLVEKPMCVSEKELDEIEETLGKTQNAFLMVAENYYYKPSLYRIKEIKDHIGKIQSLYVKKTFEQKSYGWKNKYGALLEGGVHFIALISDILNDTPDEVKAMFPDCKQGESERSSIVNLKYKDGISATLTYSWNTKSLPLGIFQQSYISGDKGKITFESNGIYVYLSSRCKTKLYIPKPWDLTGNKELTRDFLACLEDKNKTPYSDFYKAKRDLTIIFQAYRSAGLQPVISL